MRPVIPDPQRNTAAPAIPHDVATRFAVRQCRAAHAANDRELADAWANLARMRLDRYLAERAPARGTGPAMVAHSWRP